MEHDEFYDKVCKPRLDSIEKDNKEEYDHINKKLDRLINWMQGEGVDKPGMIDDVRTIKKVFHDNPDLVNDVNKFRKLYKYTIGAIIFLISTIIVQTAIWIRSKFGGG